jgi:hypothetical protein
VTGVEPTRISGVRFQFVPEFMSAPGLEVTTPEAIKAREAIKTRDEAATSPEAWRSFMVLQSLELDKIAEAFRKINRVASVQTVWYDTLVINREDYHVYTDALTTAAGQLGSLPWFGSSYGGRVSQLAQGHAEWAARNGDTALRDGAGSAEFDGETAAPVPVVGRGPVRFDPGARSQRAVYGHFGRLTARDTTNGLKHYDLAKLTEVFIKI